MTIAFARRLGALTSPPPSTAPPKETSPSVAALDSDFAVILAALLCALICVLGLVAVARCSWIRRAGGRSSPESPAPAATANKGLKKKVLKSLPKQTIGEGELEDPAETKLSDCAICLADFAAGEEIRVLPQCGHAFHVACIDTWLGSHSSCPSCRAVLVVARCKKCGCGTLPSAAGSRPAPTENHVDSTFLP